MSGIIFFEDGTVVPFGQLTSVKKIMASAAVQLAGLAAQEREQLLNTVTKEELKLLVERLSTEDRDE